MTWTQAQHDSLARAIAEGALTVQYEDRRTTYRSLEDMLTLLGLMKKDLGLVATSSYVVKASHDKDVA